MKSIQIKRSITDRNNISLNDYLKDISKIKMLTPEQEKEVGKLAKEGDRKAIDKLTTSNLRFVISVAKQYQGQGLDLIDLIQAGNTGLIEAANRFDVDKGYRFISYAVWWIRQAIIQALSDNSRTIRLPISQIHIIAKINKAISEFEQLHNRRPSNEELEKIVDIPAHKIDKIMSSESKVVSIDTPFKDEEEGTLVDVIPNTNSPKADNIINEEYKKKEINMLLNTLSDREHDVIRMYFGIGCYPCTLDDIGEKFGVTYERARQIKESALKNLSKLKSLLI
jgi:RNA polymerase primary sigma factor